MTLESRPEDLIDPDLADGWLVVHDREGGIRRLPAVEGFRVMEIMRDLGLPVPATCGGAAACGTCHVYVSEAGLPRLPPIRPDEAERLDMLLAARPNSRLSCQIIWSSALDGLEVTLAPLE